jgi:hypothetical protein
LKVAGFGGLVDSCVEQNKPAITQNQYTNNEEDISAPSQDGMGSSRKRDSSFDCVRHGWLLMASLAEEGPKGAE